MKKLILFCVTIGLALSAMAQGDMSFKAKGAADLITTAPGVYAADGLYTVGLFYRAAGQADFVQLATTPVVKVGAYPGSYNGGILSKTTTPSITVPANTLIDLQLKVWNNSATSYETATTFHGMSSVFTYKTGDPAAQPPIAATPSMATGGVVLTAVPEPTTIALGLLAGGLFLLRRRQ